jgi:hypothetical protein
MAHINYTASNSGRDALVLKIKLLEAEVDFWKAKAENLDYELMNIPRALHEYGEWCITINDEVTHVILDPEWHKKESKS